MKKTIFGASILLIGLLLATSAMSYATNNNRQYDSGNLNSPNGKTNNGEKTLQNIFDNNIKNGAIDAVRDQSSVALWSESEGTTSQYAVEFLRGHKGQLWLYSTKGNKYQLTDSNSDTLVNFWVDDGDLKDGQANVIERDFGKQFGFFWRDTTANTRSYTEDSQNAYGLGTDDNITTLSYMVEDGLEIITQAGSPNAKGNNDWILAFEDNAKDGQMDGDFQDSVFYVEDMDPVPEPTTMFLLGTGLVGIAAFGRKKYMKKR